MTRPIVSKALSFASVAIAALLAASAAQARGDADNGKELATKKYACVSCHGAAFNNPIDASYPKLAGQHYDYLRQALIAYQKGDHPTFGRSNAVMAAQAKPLSAKEIDDIATYLSDLPPSLVLKR
ncbi:MAG: c-type cytochrome [Burkholderiaceae bacterium]